jgi:hypothetical protein
LVSDIPKCAVQISKEHSMQNPWEGKVVGRDWFAIWEWILSKAEHLSLWPMIFSKKYSRWRLLTFDANNGHSEVAPTASFIIKCGQDRSENDFNSCNQKLVAMKGTKWIHSSHSGGRNSDSSGLQTASGRNYWILPMDLCKGKYRGLDFE